ncbi:MAG: ATP-binding protein [Rubrivivax sp.]|nr:ATP-binding protein [Rubrivivax sp.]MDP3611490.1 ATP-binding protein [Rubrivivax sp.]
MFTRQLQPALQQALTRSPVLVLLGPRQVGKTTLAQQLAAQHPGAVVMDLERESDRAAVARPELFFPPLRDRLVVLDEVQTLPDLFRALRPEIDAHRRAGRFLLLGSASGPLLQQTSESLAGRATYAELTPFLASEVSHDLASLQHLWQRGGFPLSHLAASDELSLAWRQDFIRTFLHRDMPALGVRVPAETLRRFWTMLAHLQGQTFNASQLGLALGGASHTTVARHLDLLVDALVVRRLQPHLAHVGKRLVKSPRIYVRDSGLLHALLGIADAQVLQGHPIAGVSWEGFVIEQIAAALPGDAVLGYYRTSAGAELDLVVQVQGQTWAFEIKLSSAPKPARGFWQALQDVKPDRTFVVAPVQRGYSLAEGVQVVGLDELTPLLRLR